eukprot:176508-Prymnesium_polylepis.1
MSMHAPPSFMASMMQRKTDSMDMSARQPSVVTSLEQMIPPTVMCPVCCKKRGRTTRTKGGSRGWHSAK